ncbi:MAG: CRISPR-associated endonuclease Cas2 [Lachnospiraceae bacterium]|nr:CRISPR-associated endonuclease Cas2 [Lachnospiraceae bacterium]
MYVISYDIEQNRTRTRIAKILESYGRRVQYSVFECDISQKQYEQLYQKLAELMSEDVSGNIRFYHICRNCEARIVTMGVVDDGWLPGEKDLFII